MRDKIAVIGANGNMGSRYMRILSSIPSVKPIGLDIGDKWDVEGLDGAIIASPTALHVAHIRALFEADPDMPILCEKPITPDLEELDELLEKPITLRMVNQYKYALDLTSFEPEDHNHTYYNYYCTGNDGLLWDCINIIGLAEGTVSINNDSPYWMCAINGKPLSLQDVNAGYIADVVDWVEYGDNNHDYIKDAHRKVACLQGSL